MAVDQVHWRSASGLLSVGVLLYAESAFCRVFAPAKTKFFAGTANEGLGKCAYMVGN
jgi:hypothetical protein